MQRHAKPHALRGTEVLVLGLRKPPPSPSGIAIPQIVGMLALPGARISNETIESLRARGHEIDPGPDNVSAVIELIVSHQVARAGAAMRGGPAKPRDIDSGISGG